MYGGKALIWRGRDGRAPGAKDRLERVFVIVSLGVGGLVTAAWIAFLIWFVFFYLL